MKCVKVFNNSAVSAIMPDGRDAILLGKGIGFNKRPGDDVKETQIEKVYYVQTEMQTKFLQMLEDVRPDVMAAAEEIIAMAEESGFVLSNQATISLIDHISFAIERRVQEIDIPNLLLAETRMLYSTEFALGLRALEIIRRRCGVAMPEDEAGYIALHLVTISKGRGGTFDILNLVNAMGKIICETLNVALDPERLDTMRLMTHLKFLAQRVFRGEQEQDDESMEEIYSYLLARDPRNRLCLERLADHLRKSCGYTLSRQEKFYLLIHLTQIL